MGWNINEVIKHGPEIQKIYEEKDTTRLPLLTGVLALGRAFPKGHRKGTHTPEWRRELLDNLSPRAATWCIGSRPRANIL